MRPKSTRDELPLLPIPHLPQVFHCLDNHRNSLPAADAGRRQAVPPPIPPQLIESRGSESRSRTPPPMSARNRPAVHVGLVPIQPPHFFNRKILRRKCFVHFHAIHLL